MVKIKMLQVTFLASLIVAGLYAGRATLLFAQEEGGGGAKAPTATFENGQAPGMLPIKRSGTMKLTPEQDRGAMLFFQRCAYCHLAKTNSKACCAPSVGPDLTADFKNVSPAKEKALKDLIMKGGPTLMPGYQYGLTAKEIDDIVAYLKTLS